MLKENKSNWAGRTKCVVVFNTASKSVAVVSDVIVQIADNKDSERLVFSGPVKFKSPSKEHLCSIVLGVADRITDGLNISRKNFAISIKNMGATSFIGVGAEISGFSADLPVFFALLSASLQLKARQDVISTGHVASIEGDVAAVRGIPVKLEAALATRGLSAFIFPDLENERSLKKLTPVEHQNIRDYLVRYNGVIKTYPVMNIHDAAQVLFTDASIVLGSLTSGFFNVKAPQLDLHSPIDKTVRLLCEGIDKRFWDCLSNFLLNRDFEKAKQFLREFANFHIDRQIYPENFGHKLLQLVISLPPRLRESKKLFPLFPMDLYIKVSQHAKGKNLEDTQELYKAAFWEKHGRQSTNDVTTQRPQTPEDDLQHALFERILAEINKDNLSEKFGRSFDIGRATYITDTVTVKDGSEFNDAISSFYAHMMRHTSQPLGKLKEDAISAEAIDLVDNAFETKRRYKGALTEGKFGTNGGMRFVFDTMTEYWKQKEIKKHISRIFNEIVDPLDWDTKIKLMEVFMEKIGPHLSEELRRIPAKQLASQWDVIIRYYVESMEQVNNIIKSL